MQKLIFTTSHNELQDDIKRLIEWYKKWELKFNSSKCKVMHFGNDMHFQAHLLCLILTTKHVTRWSS